MNFFFLELPPLSNPKSHHHDSKPTRIQNSNLQCSMINPYHKCIVHPKPCNHPIPLTLPLLYFGFLPQNPYEMTKNEMKTFCYLLSICFLHNNLCNLDLLNNQWFYTHLYFAAITSFSTNLVHGSTSKNQILDNFYSIVGIVPTCYCA